VHRNVANCANGPVTKRTPAVSGTNGDKKSAIATLRYSRSLSFVRPYTATNRPTVSNVFVRLATPVRSKPNPWSRSETPVAANDAPRYRAKAR
jgi:hypothetical protein